MSQAGWLPTFAYAGPFPMVYMLSPWSWKRAWLWCVSRAADNLGSAPALSPRPSTLRCVTQATTCIPIPLHTYPHTFPDVCLHAYTHMYMLAYICAYICMPTYMPAFEGPITSVSPLPFIISLHGRAACRRCYASCRVLCWGALTGKQWPQVYCCLTRQAPPSPFPLPLVYLTLLAE